MNCVPAHGFLNVYLVSKSQERLKSRTTTHHPYWNSAVTDGEIIYGLIGVIWGFSESRNFYEIILISVKKCVVSGIFNINHY